MNKNIFQNIVGKLEPWGPFYILEYLEMIHTTTFSEIFFWKYNKLPDVLSFPDHLTIDGIYRDIKELYNALDKILNSVNNDDILYIRITPMNSLGKILTPMDSLKIIRNYINEKHFMYYRSKMYVKYCEAKVTESVDEYMCEYIYSYKGIESISEINILKYSSYYI